MRHLHATFTISAVSSVGSGRARIAWQLDEVRAVDGGVFITLDPAWARHVGETVTAAYTRGRVGRYSYRVLGFFETATLPCLNGRAGR